MEDVTFDGMKTPSDPDAGDGDDLMEDINTGDADDYLDKRRDWDEDKRKKHLDQKESCEKRDGAVDWHTKYESYRAVESPTVSVAELYVLLIVITI